jgi:hypothetical protein
MNRHVPQLIVMYSGLALIIFGVGLIIVQVMIYPECLTEANICVATWHEFHIATRFIGLVVAGFGVLLEIVGFIGSKFSN